MKGLGTHLTLAALVLILGGTVATAQTRVRVVRDRSVIWTSNFVTVATQVDEGTELEVVGRRDTWYKVIIPIDDGRRAHGFIADVNVQPVGAAAGEPPPPRSAAPPRTSAPPTPRRQGAPLRSLPRPGTLGLGIRAFGHLGYGSFLATQSFEAVLGEAPGQMRGPWYGGGGQYQSPSGIFVETGVARFRQTGERVFVFEGTVFKLGVPDTITVTPVTLTAGYRLPVRRVAPFVGGGIGQYFFSEATPFDDPSEKVKHHATSYHGVGGVEWSLTRGVAAAVQAQYTRVPDGLNGGAAAAFNEKDLGGLQLAVKLLVGGR